ncbi:hypothetical protein ONZ51_g12143 [Trametes cubensis]|uniref:Heterokaryon incompatibility domain-containing protein n=1 Tax=Trametes cubensis TaxID=1111947 RepID=A0AAD7THT8_9APHY|nr:hypothetical protein ONZ51_g12143 [Trametes cubensis]
MRPDDVCAHCWDGIFAEGFGLRNIPVFDQGGVWYGGYEYFVSYDEILARFEGPDKTKRRMRLTVGRPLSSEETGEPETEVLIVVINKLDAFRVSMGTDNPAASWIKDWAGSLRVGTSDVLALALAHIGDCVWGHQACQDFFDWAKPEASLPTRLVDCFDPLRPRIVESKGWDPHVRYVALSYVWGKNSQPNCTTSRNLSSYLEAIDISRLPRTVVDAIRVTHALGIRFLWVDSLCIIQDSCEDKNRELTKMRKVYRLAFLVIDVGSAKSASEGFLHDADPPMLVDASVWLPFTWFRRHERHPPRFMDFFDVGPRTNLIICDGDRLQNLVMRARGYTGERAWCLQEALMSGRRLRFGATLQFRCRSSPERIGNVKYHKLYGTTSAPDIIFHLAAPTLSLGSEGWFVIHAAWADIVEDYSTRALSYSEDKLVACAGIAEAFGRALGSKTEYLAGLWRDSLLWDLLWTVAPFSRSLDRRGDALAPSWSWAATDYPVDFRPYFMMRDGDAPCLQGEGHEELAEVVECVVTLQDPALPFGRVTGGHLILRAPVLGPYEVEALHYQQTDHLMLDEGYGRDVVFDALRPQAEEPDVCASSASGSRLEKVYRRVGAYSLLDSEDGGDEVLTHVGMLNSLRSEIDEQWTVPRTEIKLLHCLLVLVLVLPHPLLLPRPLSPSPSIPLNPTPALADITNGPLTCLPAAPPLEFHNIRCPYQLDHSQSARLLGKASLRHTSGSSTIQSKQPGMRITSGKELEVLNGCINLFKMRTTEDDPSAPWIQERTRTLNIGDPYMLSIAKAYVEEYTPLPTRLIDCSNPLSPRIVQTDANMYGLYVALSYVWGKDQSGYCTTEGNLAAHMERIDVAILPQTIQDAIRFVERPASRTQSHARRISLRLLDH